MQGITKCFLKHIYHNACFIKKVPIGGGSSKSVLSDRLIVYNKSRKQLLHRKYLFNETDCSWAQLSYKIIQINIQPEFSRI